ncbi:MAG TPA: glycine cleavage system aminomethyltransferase GcvT [Actinomycetota bacterium]|nr:glycine cleavage system aminomethyltransferase GcvT [Actinomycetota bacterium]
MTEALRSPLDAAHRAADGRMVTFAGWRLPVRYGSILAEGRAVREAAGMFDVSHMGRFLVRGPGAFDLLQRLGTNDLARVSPGRAQYMLWCTPQGGVIDDLIVLWLGADDFLVVVNGSRREVDWDHLMQHAPEGIDAVDDTFTSAMIAVQGPAACEIVGRLGADIPPRRFGAVRTVVADVGAVVSRTGYTGEDGVEIVCEAGAGPRVWEALRAEGVVPCGLGSRDALRMEMGYPLYGHELDLDIDPREAGVGFAVDLGKDFVGRDALAAREPARRLVGFVAAQRCIPQPGDRVGEEGVVTSGGTSVVLDAPIGLAYVPLETSLGPATLHNRGKEIAVTMRELPLIERGRPAAPAKAGASAT